MQHVPQSLRAWFILHFVTDMLFALPLLLAPQWLYTLFGFPFTEPFAARLVGAALVGIGGTSFLVRNKTLAAYDTLLTLKILWSLTAILGMLLSLIAGAPSTVWLIIAVFSVFSTVWIYYKNTL